MSGYDAFAPVYDDWSAHMTDDVDFYVALAAGAEGPVVELAVGNGRVAVPIAQRTGRRVIRRRTEAERQTKALGASFSVEGHGFIRASLH